jgi:predicted DNA-binding protein
MSSQRITIRVSDSVLRRPRKHAGMKGRSESALVRDALENFLADAALVYLAERDRFDAIFTLEQIFADSPQRID